MWKAITMKRNNYQEEQRVGGWGDGLVMQG